MSYIACLNGFNLWLESNALEPVSQLLYFRLLNVFNRAGWPESVQVDNQRIMSMTGQHTEKSAIAARDRLVSAGLISYQRGKKGSPGRYALIPFPCIKYSENNTVENIHCISGQFPASHFGGNREANPAPPLQPYKDEEEDAYEERFPPNPPKGGTGDAPGESAPVPDKPTGKRERNPSRSPELAPDEEAALLAVSPRLCDAARDWFRYRAEIRKPFNTPTGRRRFIRRVLENAESYGSDAMADAIEAAMSSGYQGIVWEKLPQYAQGGGRGGGRGDDEEWERAFDMVHAALEGRAGQ